MAALTWSVPRELVRFALIGVASTLAYVVLYALPKGAIGAYAANLVALVVTAVGNWAANRRLTFGVRGSAGCGRPRSGLGGVRAWAWP